jgi:hypothetical protein
MLLLWLLYGASLLGLQVLHSPQHLALNFFELCCGMWVWLWVSAGVQARARQGNAASAEAEAISSDAVLAALADAALNIVARFDNNSSSTVATAAGTAAGGSVTALSGNSSSSSSGCGSVLRQRAAGLGSPSAKAQQLMQQLQEFMVQYVYPAEATFDAHAHGPNR